MSRMAMCSYGWLCVTCSILRQKRLEFFHARWLSIFRPEVVSFYQPWTKVSDQKVDNFSQPELSLPAASWHLVLVYQGRPLYNHVWHGLVMGDHEEPTASSNQKVEDFSKAGTVLNSVGGCWSFVVWSIKKTTIKSHRAQSCDEQLCETFQILHPVIWGFLLCRLNSIYCPEDCSSRE